MIPFEVFLGDTHLGTGISDHGLSFHYLCPKCGNIWARVISHGKTDHGALHIHCPGHETPYRLPAAIVQDWRFYKTRWPIEALVRDFLYLFDLNESAPIISNNMPGIAYDQHQAA